jgi:hypothetical protein
MIGRGIRKGLEHDDSPAKHSHATSIFFPKKRQKDEVRKISNAIQPGQWTLSLSVLICVNLWLNLFWLRKNRGAFLGAPPARLRNGRFWLRFRA